MNRAAVYAGTFDPITRGHLDVIERAARIFNRLIIAVAVSTRKATLFSVEERRALVKQVVRRFKNVEVDVFAMYTDNESWAGDVHPCQALERYRQKTGIAARLACIGFTATSSTLGDPEDSGTLELVGFDAAAPRLMSEFAAGQL